MATFAGLTTTGWLHSYTYSDGLGRELQTKVQAENGKAWVMQNGVPVQIDDITDRFVATGRKIYNNKGNVIKQYEPWFSDGHLYEPEAELTQYGVTPVMYYDAPGRLIKTEFPDGTLSRVEFDAWQQKTFDRNDCVNGSQWLTTMQQGTTAQQRAATLAQAHNNTPQVTDIDTMGRPYRITDNAGNGNYFVTLNHIDISGLTVMVTDAKGRDMTRHVYDMTEQLCFTFNIDSGRRWMVVNALDKPVHTWDNLQRKTTLQYDALNRPVATLLYNNNTTALKVESITYGTSATGYTIGKPIIIRDQSGKLDITSYDFKGNMLSSTRRFCNDYNIIINWNTYADPTGESFVSSFTFDAMNRLVTETTPDGKVRTYEYNKAGLLERVLLDQIEYVSNIEYNEKGQRSEIYFGNGSKTRYYHDLQNFRLTRLVTSRDNGSIILQDLNYTYDPEGNIVQQNDNAQQINYFKNTVVAPVGKYEYDALYRIIKAEGRELTNLSVATDADFENSIGIVNEGFDVMQNYTQLYSYDELGNIRHVESQGRWNRNYTYDPTTNRLLNTGSGYNYTYDAHGNMVSMSHLSTMEWDFKGNLSKTIRTGNGYTAYYRYDSQGNRVRKIYIHDNITDERIYIGNYEIYRRKVSGTLNTERETSFVSDDQKRIAIVDTRNIPTPVEVTIRYQYDNHLGSACLELDGSGAVISYEEYHPFGTTSYRAGRNATETSLKRYKYVGKERDEETGLYYYGARYYAAWLSRFVSVDQLQIDYPQLTPYNYAGNKPITYIDLNGLQSTGDKPYGSKSERNQPEQIYKDGATVTNQFGSWQYKNESWRKYDDVNFSSETNQTAFGGTFDDYKKMYGLPTDFTHAEAEKWQKGQLLLYNLENELPLSTDYKTAYDAYYKTTSNYKKDQADKASGLLLGGRYLEMTSLFWSSASGVQNFQSIGKISPTKFNYKVVFKNSANINESEISQGFNSFSALKRAIGPAGPGQSWHHIVEQTPTNIAKFGPRTIHNTNNIIKLPYGSGSLHAKVSGYYSSIQGYTGGLTVRTWVSNQSFKQQYDFGLKIIKQFNHTP